MNMDPTEPLYDRYWTPDGLVRKPEQPELGCPCQNTGLLGQEWLYRREPRCSCPANTDNFDTVLHDASCDSVPCPFCPLEANDGQLLVSPHTAVD